MGSIAPRTGRGTAWEPFRMALLPPPIDERRWPLRQPPFASHLGTLTLPTPLTLAARIAVPAAVAAALTLAPRRRPPSPRPPCWPDRAPRSWSSANVALDRRWLGRRAIWRQLDADGRSHIYVAQYRDGRWLAPQRVDTALPYDSFEPRLAAAPGGRLVAVFAQDWAQPGLAHALPPAGRDAHARRRAVRGAGDDRSERRLRSEHRQRHRSGRSP